MSRHSAHAHADDFEAVRPAEDKGTVGLGLFDGAPLEPAVPDQPDPSVVPIDAVSEGGVRRARRRHETAEKHDSNARPWIDLGKPIALMVAMSNGRVTAGTFRDEAEALEARGTRRLPASDPAKSKAENQRRLSYVATMFAELVEEGKLRKLVRDDHSVVKVYDSTTGNYHTVYEYVPEVAR